MKKYYLIAPVLIVAGVIYYTGLYTYFIRNDVQESLPATSDKPEASVQTLASGNFVKVDLVHKGSGEAKIIRFDDKNILRFENFNVTSGPDLYVYLTKSVQLTGDIKSLGDYVDLGLLKGTSGNQNYEIGSIDISEYKTAVVWCRRFGVLFTYAVMK
ncbi:MAG: DM13 domain-containing protein [bacterium]|nr:DM13 domain-containing protein [bacterium]